MPSSTARFEDRFAAEYWFSCYSHFDIQSEVFAESRFTQDKRLVYYDVETQKRADEVGGWEHADKMLISVAVTFSEDDGFRVWYETTVPDMIDYMNAFDLVVSFNGDNFDSKVLSYYGDVSTLNRKSFDVAQYLSSRLKHRIRLESVAMATLKVGKSADGLAALQWWKEGKIDKIIEYCQQDVQVLRDVVKFGQENGYIEYRDLQEQPVQMKVDW